MSSVLDLSPFNAILQRLEGVTSRLEGVAGGASARSGAAPATADAPIILAFDAFAKQKLDAIKAAAKEIGQADVDEATNDFEDALKMLRDLLVGTTKCKKPENDAWGPILKPLMDLGNKAQKACDNRSPFFHHRKATATAVNIVTFPTSPAPASHVQNVLEEMDFHAVKVMLKKEPKETEWIKAVKGTVTGLQDWIKDNCKMGVDWKADGEDASAFFASKPLGQGGQGVAAAPAKGKGGGKGPPIPTHRPKIENVAQASAAPAGPGGMSAVFAEIHGKDAGGLKKVTADMKTKNRAEDDKAPGGPSLDELKAAKATGGAKAGVRGKGPRGPPIKEEQRGNWIIENFENDKSITLPDVDKSQLVAIINCKNCTIKIDTKVKNISIDGCERVTLVCSDVISSVELVNSDRCQVHTTGVVGSFALDKCNGANIFLGKKSQQAEIVSSKSSEMNLTIPDPDGEDGDIIEIPIPEQFVTKLVGPKKAQTTVSSLYS